MNIKTAHPQCWITLCHNIYILFQVRRSHIPSSQTWFGIQMNTHSNRQRCCIWLVLNLVQDDDKSSLGWRLPRASLGRGCACKSRGYVWTMPTYSSNKFADEPASRRGQRHVAPVAQCREQVGGFLLAVAKIFRPCISVCKEGVGRRPVFDVWHVVTIFALRKVRNANIVILYA